MKMNVLDRAIGFIDPRAGLQRARSRFVMDQLEKIRGYDAAGRGRRFDGWRAGNTTPNQETEMSLERLRARSRDLVRNNPWAARAVECVANNTIGTGIRPTPNTELKKISKAWTDWAETTECDFNGLTNYYGLQRLAALTLAQSGEVVIRRRRTAKNTKSKVPYQLQVFEPDIIDHSRNYVADVQAEGNFIVQGVEFDKNGRRVGYWLYEAYPSETVVMSKSITSKFVNIDDVIHVYREERPGQVRGVPMGASVFLRLRDLDGFEDAELMRQKIAACFAVFVTESIDSTPVKGKTSKSPLPEKIEPGIIERLSPGETVSMANPPTKEGYGEFTTVHLRGIAQGYGISYEALTGDLTQVNFSSGRMGWIEMSRNINHLQQNVFIPMMCNKTWAWFMEGLSITGVYAGADVTVKWTSPRREMIDPVKEVQGIVAQIRGGLISWPEAVSEQGYNPDELLDEIESHNKKLDEKEIILDSDPRYTDAAGKAKVEPGAEEGATEGGKPAPKKTKPSKTK
jgi:lambda family phage portal protein